MLAAVSHLNLQQLPAAVGPQTLPCVVLLCALGIQASPALPMQMPWGLPCLALCEK